jgi:hypothetical protein
MFSKQPKRWPSQEHDCPETEADVVAVMEDTGEDDSAQPIQVLMEQVDWKPIPNAVMHAGDDMPYATQTGTLELGSVTLRCYTLSDGQHVVDADDVARWFGEAQGGGSR